jgi:hypothetical protein
MLDLKKEPPPLQPSPWSSSSSHAEQSSVAIPAAESAASDNRLAPKPEEFRDLFHHWGEEFKPPIGTKNTVLTGPFGVFKVSHGLVKPPPNKIETGQYDLQIEMTPNEKVGQSQIGFIQTARQGTQNGSWAKQLGDDHMSASMAARTESKEGWRVDRTNPKQDKTPFFGMGKDGEGNLHQYSSSRVGQHGGGSAMMHDRPGVSDPDHMEFTATAKDTATGAEFGAISWGYEFDSSRRLFKEETPALVQAGSARLEGRDRAFDKWNKDVATEGSNIDKVCGR